MNVVGYEKHLAESSDLLTWNKLGKILTFSEDGWDKWQDDGGPDLMDHKARRAYRMDPFRRQSRSIDAAV